MAKNLLLLSILLVFAIGVAVPAERVTAADEAKHIIFTATSTSLCNGNANDDPRCRWGDPVPLPNGRYMVKNFVVVVQYDATDPRWDVVCVCSADQFPPTSPNVFPYQGKFVCTPTDPAYAGGWWEGTTHGIGLPDKTISHWTAQGYGKLDRLLAIERNSMHNTGEIEITELPGYQP